MCSLETCKEIIQDIRKSVMVYIIGCCCFVLVALASLWFGYYVIRYHNDHELPVQLTIISLAGGLLLWEMIKSFRFRNSLPKTFKPITEQQHPALFNIINEVTTTLKLSPIRRAYICPDAIAAVFIQPRFHYPFLGLKRELVIGLAFLTQMDDDEIRTMLYHEFGHYMQKGMRASMSIYTIGQLSRSFVSIKEDKKMKEMRMMLKLQIHFFSFFSVRICEHINRAYSKLAKQMEYEADDVAVKYMGASMLKQTLIHAASTKYNYEVVQWGLDLLKAQGVKVSDPYYALTLIDCFAQSPKQMFPTDVLTRIERLGDVGNVMRFPQHTVKQTTMNLFVERELGLNVCPASQFASWLQEGYSIYKEQKILSSSVCLIVHLEKMKHEVCFDISFKVLLDGQIIGVGNFFKGFTIKKMTSPGKHVLTVRAPATFCIESVPFEFETEKGVAYRLELDYSHYSDDGMIFHRLFGEIFFVV